MTYTISSPDYTVDLDEYNVAQIARGGYSQVAGEELVREKARIRLTAANDNARADTIQNLNYLAEQAASRSSPRSLFYHHLASRPIITAKTPTESTTRRALVNRILIPALDPAHYGSRAAVDMEVILEREPFWRILALGSRDTIISGAGTLNNHDQASPTNRLDLDVVDFRGDAPGPLYFEVEFTGGTADSTLILALRPEPPAGFAAERMYYFASESSAISSGSLAATTGHDPVPGNQMWTETSGAAAGSTFTIDWDITNVATLHGRYRVYALAKAGISGDFNAGIVHGFTGYVPGQSLATVGDQPLPPLTGPTPWYWNPVYLGNIQIPPDGDLPGVTYNNPYTLRLQLTKKVATSAEYFVGGIFMIPADGQILSLSNCASMAKAWIDGDLRRAWGGTALGVVQRATLWPEGAFLRMPANVNRRIYLYYLTPGIRWLSTRTLDVDTFHVPMVRHLAGGL